jgi:peroxiredoxin Q/BCP
LLSKGDQAPEFTTVDESGNHFRLGDYLGQKVVLYFFPRDFTPGCTAQACSLRDGFDIMESLGAKVFGVSGGSAELHMKFRRKYDLPFHILVDEDLDIAKLYNAKSRLSVLGIGTKRITYLINENGRIDDIIGGSSGVERVNVRNHADQIASIWKLELE